LSKPIDVKDAIAMAIRMEKEGHAFYVRAADQTSSGMGRAIFASLALDEKAHLETFQRMFRGKVGKEDWDALAERTEGYGEMPVFPKDPRSAGAEPDSDDLAALKVGMESEARSVDHYTAIKERVDDGTVAGILEEIIRQERRHYALLEEEFIHLSNTGFWHEFDYLGERAF